LLKNKLGEHVQERRYKMFKSLFRQIAMLAKDRELSDLSKYIANTNIPTDKQASAGMLNYLASDAKEQGEERVYRFCIRKRNELRGQE